jgi:ubiquinone/menaquinone biosynthesis C-methylase UbiE/GT2 family glycosyltransferase
VKTITLSIIIPTCDRPELLTKCLDLIAPGKQTLAANFYETIVTDDGANSIENLVAQNYPWVKWVRGPRKGPAANRNNGSKHAIGEWLIFTDDDCLPSGDWLENFYSAITINKKVKAYEGAIYAVGNIDKDFAECPVNDKGGCFWSANICVETTLFKNINGFDENYFLAAQEDQDIYIQLKKYTNVLFVPNAKVFHPVRTAGLLESIKKIDKRCLNWLYYAKKNKKELGYKNEFSIIKGAVKSQLRAAYFDIKKRYPRRLLYTLSVISIGVPRIIIQLLIMDKLNNRKFQWMSSKTGDVDLIQKVHNKLSWYYSAASWRENYQLMLGQEPLPEKNEFSYLILEYILIKNSKNILDIGCSNGRIFRQLKQLNFTGKYTGIEVADYLIEINRKNHPEANWETAGAYDIPFPNEHFDLSFAFFVLEHLVFPERALHEMMRVIEKEGTLVLVFPDFIESKRFSSQQLGLSPNDTAIKKLKKGKIVDAILSIYDSRIRLPKALKYAHKNVGDFPINSNLICFNHPDMMSPDFDAVYIASKKEVEKWALENGYHVSYPYGKEAELKEKVFMAITKSEVIN